MSGYKATYGKLLEEIAREADKIALKYFRAANLQIEKKRDGSRVTQADKEVEAMARTRVAASGLELDVLGEEMGGDGANAPATKRPRMIIDPIDGTEEFSRGIPTFGTLMGIEKDGEIVAAMVSAPGLHSRWWAYKGEGAYRDGVQLHVSDTPVLAKSMVFSTGTGPSKDSSDQVRIRKYLDAARNSRSFGGFWQHMLVAEGAVESALDWTSKPWDLSPLILMVEEAGGRSTTITGKRTIYEGSLLSTNGKIHDEVLAILK
ncbi:MAG TPA: inositol monophosphatase family protein [Candidatus Dormibacteraeota bacterium]|nr:inositol monophosphatase family protein [Candidatus Dormibacteraeota bacterium]